MDERVTPKTSAHLLNLRKKYRTNYREIHSARWYNETGDAGIISCRQCGSTGPAATLFYRVRAYPRGFAYRCKQCTEASNRAGRRMRTYGVSPETYERMFREQAGSCAICGDQLGSTSGCVDHDHQNGRVRALLCSACNLGLGNFMESPERMLQAIAYLDMHRAPEALAA